MSVEYAIGVPTSRAPARTRSVIEPFPLGPRRRKMFSIMMIVESTTIPKSTAPNDSRLADCPVATSAMIATVSASGMFSAVMIAARVSLRKSTSTKKTKTIPMRTFSRTV